MARSVWVVSASHGCYSDRQEWLVRVFDTEAEAHAWKEWCVKRADEVRARMTADDLDAWQEVPREWADWAREYDAAMASSYPRDGGARTVHILASVLSYPSDDGPRYRVESVPFGAP